MITSTLTPELQPRLVAVELDGLLTDDAMHELAEKAATDVDECYGYFPAMDGIDQNLPASRRLAGVNSVQVVDGVELGFNFLRMSLKRQEPLVQEGDNIFHLDSDAATALTGDLATITDRQVWRLLLNLSPTYGRTLAYVDVDPTTVPIIQHENYAHCPPDALPKDAIRTLEIPPRVGGIALGVFFCSSQVLHSGRDDEHGHFVAGYGKG